MAADAILASNRTHGMGGGRVVSLSMAFIPANRIEELRVLYPPHPKTNS
jgi:hypothetical protein